jgi:hypothetical protein
MELNLITGGVIFLAFLINTFFGFILEDIFVTKTSNKRYLLRRWLRELIHDSAKGRFLKTHLALLVIMGEILFIAITTTISSIFFLWLVKKTLAFYFPILILAIASFYFGVKKRFAPKLRLLDWIIYILILLLSGTFIWLIIQFQLFGYGSG